MAYKYNPLLSGKLDKVGANELKDLEDVTTSGTVNGYVLTYGTTLDTWTPKAGGAGDMLKSDYVSGIGTVYNTSRLEGETLATLQAHNVAASKITSGTLGLARIPAVDDARIPDVETLSYGAAFAEGQIPNLPTTKITSGTLGLARIPSITNACLAGEITSDKISALPGTAVTYPLNADTVGTIAIKAAGVGNDELAASGLDIAKCTVGTAGLARIPALPTTRITSGTLAVARHDTLDNLNGTVALTQVPTMDDAHIPDLETLSYGGTFATAQIPNLPASKTTTGTFNANRIPALPTSRITTGTFGLVRIPSIDDARIPDLETLSYGGAFATAQIPGVGAYKITSGTLAVARHETLNNLNGTVALSQVPTMDDGHIPDLDTLSYGGAFAAAQIPTLDSSKVATGTFNADRIPSLPASRITTGTFNVNRIDTLDNLKGTVTAEKVASLPTAKITTGTFGLARIPAIDDARIPDLDTLSYSGAFAVAQIPSLSASKITTGSFNADRIPALPTSRITTGTFGLVRIPTMDDAHIPDVDGLTYSGAFATAQIPGVGAYKITSGTLNADRIPALPTARITTGTFNVARMPSQPIPQYLTIVGTLSIATGYHVDYIVGSAEHVTGGGEVTGDGSLILVEL